MMTEIECGFADEGPDTGAQRLVLFGPSLQVAVGFDPYFNPQSGNTPILQAQNIPALVDTGATDTGIDAALAQRLNLPVSDGVTTIAGIGGREEVPNYLAQIHIPALERTVEGVFAGVRLTESNQRHQILIGRTFLQECIMNYNGTTGRVTISA